MVRRFGQKSVWIVLAVMLGMWSLGTEVCAQFKSTEVPSPPDTMQTFAPPPLAAHQSSPSVAGPPLPRSQNASQYNPVLNRRQKLFWGTVGLVVHSVCDSNGEERAFPNPDPLLEARERTCVECERVGDRAFDAVVDGIFSSDA